MNNEHKKKISEALKACYSNPERRKQISERVKEYYSNNPDSRKDVSERMKMYYSNPDNRKKIGDVHRGKPLSEEHKKKLSDAHKGKPSPKKGTHSSEETKKKVSDSLKGKCGPLSRNWKGGISDRGSPHLLNEFRQAVKKRDDYTCQICHDRNHKGRGSSLEIHAHHIKAWKDYPSERYNVDNGITLCKYCHKWIHSLNVLSFQ